MTDRRTRIVVGLAVGLNGLATLGDLLQFGMAVGVALSAVALILIGTGLIRVCPLYHLLGRYVPPLIAMERFQNTG